MARASHGLLVEKSTPKAATDSHGFPRINLFDFSEVGGYLCESAKIRGQVLLAQGTLQLLGIGSVAESHFWVDDCRPDQVFDFLVKTAHAFGGTVLDGVQQISARRVFAIQI